MSDSTKELKRKLISSENSGRKRNTLIGVSKTKKVHTVSREPFLL